MSGMGLEAFGFVQVHVSARTPVRSRSSQLRSFSSASEHRASTLPPMHASFTSARPQRRSLSATPRASPHLHAAVTPDAAWPKARRRPALRAALALRVGGVKDVPPSRSAARQGEGRTSRPGKVPIMNPATAPVAPLACAHPARSNGVRQPLRCTVLSAKPALGARVPPRPRLPSPRGPLAPAQARRTLRPARPREHLFRAQCRGRCGESWTRPSPPLRHRARQRLRVRRDSRPARPRNRPAQQPRSPYHPAPPHGRPHRADPSVTGNTRNVATRGQAGFLAFSGPTQWISPLSHFLT